VINVANTFTATAGRGEIIERLVVSEGGFLRSRGGIEIGLRAGQTDTYLTQEVLLLGSKAKADVTPGLEIKTNDVKASHSASITRLSEDDLFMVGSRGLEPDQARQMLIDGFLWSLLERVPEGVREEVRGLNIVRNR
jgi:Fe-S cluster assembly scaffold protein SufB